VKEFTKEGYLLASADECRKAISLLNNLAPAGKFTAVLTALEVDPGYRAQAGYRKKLLNDEAREKDDLIRSLQSENIPWWKERIGKLEGGGTKDVGRRAEDAGRENWKYVEDTLKNRRILSFLSLLCYMNATSMVAQQDENAAGKVIAIYEMSDPLNPEPNYLRATLLARRQDNPAAIGQLRIAVAKGCADKARLNNQTEFTAMSGSREWQALLQAMDH
jgi:hypothetical protein